MLIPAFPTDINAPINVKPEGGRGGWAVLELTGT